MGKTESMDIFIHEWEGFHQILEDAGADGVLWMTNSGNCWKGAEATVTFDNLPGSSTRPIKTGTATVWGHPRFSTSQGMGKN